VDTLRAVVYRKPLAIFRFGFDEWWNIVGSKDGSDRFTIVHPHTSLEKVSPPTVCLIFAEKPDGKDACFFAYLSARRPASTLDTWLRVEGAREIVPATEEALLEVVSEKSLATNLRKRLADGGSVIPLSPTLSTYIVQKLTEIDGNREALRSVTKLLDGPRSFSGNGALQHDAVKMALGAFGISLQERASVVEIVAGLETALARIRIREDAVIEHDARQIPSFTLKSSFVTGRAVFENSLERLEVITANKRPLEEVLGVDLIYLNAIKQNIVMVQYKMLEAERDHGDTDWMYRPDAQLAEEIARMKAFSAARPPGAFEYRINPQVFYFKFVQRDAGLARAAITIPMDHYEVLRKDPGCRGKKGAFRISYKTLGGRYLRQEPFLELIRAGYIGAHAETTADLKQLIDAVLENDRAVVAAVHAHRERGR
jgi:hypothetical protein